MVSDETRQTVTKAMEMVKQVLPADAFYGNGPSVGPSAFMIDDSTVERSALSITWPSAHILLCTFHFLQRRWTWLYEGKNCIQKEDRVTLIQLVRGLVYSQSEVELKDKHTLLTSSETAKKYPSFIQHMENLLKARAVGTLLSKNSFDKR